MMGPRDAGFEACSSTFPCLLLILCINKMVKNKPQNPHPLAPSLLPNFWNRTGKRRERCAGEGTLGLVCKLATLQNLANL